MKKLVKKSRKPKEVVERPAEWGQRISASMKRYWRKRKRAEAA